MNGEKDGMKSVNENTKWHEKRRIEKWKKLVDEIWGNGKTPRNIKKIPKIAYHN